MNNDEKENDEIIDQRPPEIKNADYQHDCKDKPGKTDFVFITKAKHGGYLTTFLFSDPWSDTYEFVTSSYKYCPHCGISIDDIVKKLEFDYSHV